mgnify:CR=1 FL=1
MTIILTRRSFAGLAVAAVGASLTAACGGGNSAGSGSTALEKTTVSIGLGKDPGLAPQMVAIDKGFLKAEGFTDIKTSTYDAGALSGPALAAGEIDLWGPGDLPPINMRHNGVPIVVTGTSASGWSEKLVVRDDATIATAQDLTKIKIGSLTGATSSTVANLEKLNGLPANSIKAVNLSPAEQLVALANNEIQGIITWNPWPAQFQAKYPDVKVKYIWEQNTSHFPWAMDKPMLASYAPMLFVLREDYIKDNPNSSSAVMRAMFKAQAWLQDKANRTEAIQIFAKYSGYDPALIDKFWDDYDFTPNLDQAYLDDMNSYTKFLADTGAIKNPQNPISYTDTAFVKAYNPSLVTFDGGWKP